MSYFLMCECGICCCYTPNIYISIGFYNFKTLKQMVDAMKPKNIVPIHTFNAGDYKNLFSVPIVELKDEEIVRV